MVDASELSSQILLIFIGLSKICVISRYYDGRPRSFCWPILDAFFQLLASIVLTDSINQCFAGRKQFVIYNSLPISPDTHYTFTWHLLWCQPVFCNSLRSVLLLRPFFAQYRRTWFIFHRPQSIFSEIGSISFRFFSDSQMETRSIKFFSVTCGTQASSFLMYSAFCKWFRTIFWSTFRSITCILINIITYLQIIT